MDGIKRIARSLLTHQAVTSRLPSLDRGAATVFMLHRFADAETGMDEGYDPHQLRTLLAYLRRERYNLVALNDLYEHLASDATPVSKTVAFTIDDGYGDFARIAAPIFAEFDCPATVFLTTGFLDGRLWLWWDQVAYLLDHTSQSQVVLELGTERLRCQWSDQPSRRAVRDRLVEHLRRVPNQEKDAAIGQLAMMLDVEIPEQVPAMYAPLSWDEVRTTGRQGISFGPHSVTHPVLPQTADAAAEWEIRESWARVRAETEAHIPVFCYPNGDFSARDADYVRDAGMRAAYTTQPGYVEASLFHPGAAPSPYALPRFALSEDPSEYMQIISGLERVKMAVRAIKKPRSTP